MPFQFILPDSIVEVLPDPSGRLSIDDLTRSPHKDQFRVTSPLLGGLDYSIHTYWLRFRLSNPLGEEARICLGNPTGADRCDFYLHNDSSGWNQFSTGFLYPWNKRDGFQVMNRIPIIIRPHKQITVYNRLENTYFFQKPRALSVEIASTDQLLKHSYINSDSSYEDEILLSLYCGVLFFGLCFNLAFYVAVKESMYLYFSLFILYFLIENITPPLGNLAFRERPAVLWTLYNLNRSTGIFLLVQFVRRFLKLKLHFPRWDKISLGISIAVMVTYLVRFFIEPFLSGKWSGSIFLLSRILFDAGLISVLVTFLKISQRNDKSIRLLRIATIPALIVWITGFLVTDYYRVLDQRFSMAPPAFVDQFEKWFDLINNISVTWLTISFSAILLFRYLELRKENAEQALERERLAKEREIEHRQFIETQKTELEKTVRERTVSLKKSLDELKFMQAQLIESEKMTSQMNPHFVFNSLNTIQNYIFSNDKKKANYYLGKFSDLMRKVLDNTSKPSIALADEVGVVRLYLDLEEARFAGEFSSRMDIDPAIDLETIEVPPMLIQPYAENALKHGLLHLKGPKELRIAIVQSPDEQSIEIMVSDNGIGRAKSFEINKRRINHQSFATKANATRLEAFNRRFNKQITIRTVDEVKVDGSAAGTTVVICIPNCA